MSEEARKLIADAREMYKAAWVRSISDDKFVDDLMVVTHCVPTLCDHLGTSLQREAELENASRSLLDELSCYYFEAEDSELEAVNRLRKLVGMRDQLPKQYEAELQAREAESSEPSRRTD